MKQQKRFKWRKAGNFFVAVLLVAASLLSVNFRFNTNKVYADDPPTGTQCPAGTTYSGGQMNACVGGSAGITGSCPAGQTPRAKSGGAGTPTYVCTVAPTPVANFNPVAAAADGKDQPDCDDKYPGTVFDDKAKKCLSPDNASQCPDGYTFEEGDNKNADPTTHSKCLSDEDPCIIPKTGVGTTALRWAACPIVTAVNVAMFGCPTPKADKTADATDKSCTGGLNGIIMALLFTDTSSIFGTQGGGADAGAYNATSKAYYTSWSVFRSIGVGLVIIAGLIMIVSEAFGVGVVDAYTIRKLLPRLLVAAIGITLSWSICAFIITLFNDLGSWARDLIQFPFKGLNAGNVTFMTVAAQWLGLGAGSLYLAAMGPGAIISMLFTMFIALLIGAAILIIRQMLIILCVLVAPLAIACAVLPNTQKLFSLWLSTFVRTLAMYPIIVGFIALGAVFSAIASSTPSTGSAIIGILAYVIPYFMIPYAFKLAGGAMVTVGGAIGGATSGYLSSRKEKHMGAFNDAKHRLKVGEGFKEGKSPNSLRSRLNRATMFAGNAREGLRLNKKFGRKGADGKRQFTLYDKGRMETTQAGEILMHAREHADKDEKWQAIKANDDYARAGTYASEQQAHHGMLEHFNNQTYKKALADNGGDTAAAQAAVTAAAADNDAKALHAAHMVEVMGGYSKTRQAAATTALAEAGTALDGDEAGAGVYDMAHANVRGANGNRVLARNLAAKNSGVNANAGRDDVAVGAGGSMQMADAALDGTLTLDTAAAKQIEQVSERNAPGKITANKPMGARAIMSGLQAKASKALADKDYDGYAQAVADQKSYREAAASAGGAAYKHVVKADRQMDKIYHAELSNSQATHTQSRDNLAEVQRAHNAGTASRDQVEAARQRFEQASAHVEMLKASRAQGEDSKRSFGSGRPQKGGGNDDEAENEARGA